MTLYEITNELINESDEVLKAELEKEFYKKLSGYGKAVRNLDSDIMQLKEEEQRLAERRKEKEKQTKRIKDAILSSMLAVGKEKVKTSLFDFSVRNGADSLVIDEKKEIPKKFFTPQDPKLDKKALNKWAKENPGMIENFAHFEPSRSLIIK